MSRFILVESTPELLRAALLVDGKLAAIEIDRSSRPTRVGVVVRAQTVRNVRGLGTILKLPDGTEALLDAAQGGMAPSAGDMITVQLTRDPRGDKLAVASRKIALGGRALIHLPLESGITVSKRLVADTARRDALLAGLADRPGGWIIRRTALLTPLADFLAEAGALSAEAMRLGTAPLALPPADAARRLLVDYGLPAPDGILVSGRRAEASVTAWCNSFAPSLSSRIERQDGPPSLFDLHDLDSAIAALGDIHTPLAAGGSLAIERTEAMTAIDVNAGSEPNLLAANLAAAAEIARQLRLRHIGGLVVVDFISLSRPADRARMIEAFKAALADDPAQTYVLPMSSLGLVEMTRERRGPELTP